MSNLDLQNKIIKIIYDKIKDINFYNYDNDERLKDVKMEMYNNMLDENCITIRLDNRDILIQGITTWVGAPKV